MLNDVSFVVFLWVLVSLVPRLSLYCKQQKAGQDLEMWLGSGTVLFVLVQLLFKGCSSVIPRLSPFQNMNIEVVQAYTYSHSRVGEPGDEAVHGVCLVRKIHSTAI